MSTSATLPNAIQIRPSRLVGLLIAVAIVSGVTTWSVSQAMTDAHVGTSPKSDVASSPGPATKTYVDGVVVLGAEDRAGSSETCTQRRSTCKPSQLSAPNSKSHLGQRLPNPSIRERRHCTSPEQQAAIYGNVHPTS